MLDLNIETLKKAKVPNHVAIIMDGNGRWARQKLMERTFGHRAGVEAIEEAIRACTNLGIKYLTLYAFSTENWKRPKTEVTLLMKLLVEYLKKETPRLSAEGVRLNTIGEIEELPADAKRELARSVEMTRENAKLVLTLALNYGCRNDMKNAVSKIASECCSGAIGIADIDEGMIASYLSTGDLPDPDLLIRTGGEQRLSNFLLWESAYAELYFTDIFWPDFKEINLYEAVGDYQNRERRFGGLK
ncbi:undecaprenyl pyrophosphate synthase UppS [Peptoclostridium acidaminophilum DSM 3953]|uniref:Isoprenyl transferase n=1 Tax=Peptoclostridium acidaminophilum DSM 3953 TaxID=1286171 RepID=W8U6X5_PEPAC|nr:isoprenyl transferase [Peptoclostridium acidaminophilum]AHM56626.1 undecaprenyl pyrophosphate synthase UppS [Peptoclostridium acidaminophilum DSM 3953]